MQNVAKSVAVEKAALLGVEGGLSPTFSSAHPLTGPAEGGLKAAPPEPSQRTLSGVWLGSTSRILNSSEGGRSRRPWKAGVHYLLLDFSTPQLLKKGRPVRLRAYQAGLWGCYIIPDGSVGLFVASDRYETLEAPGSCPHDRGSRHGRNTQRVSFPLGASPYLAPRIYCPGLPRWLTLSAFPRLRWHRLMRRADAKVSRIPAHRMHSTSPPFSLPLCTASNIVHCTEVSIDFAYRLNFITFMLRLASKKHGWEVSMSIGTRVMQIRNQRASASGN